MAETFSYDALSLERVEESFEIHGEVLVSLPKHHAVACIDLIELITGAEEMRYKGFRWIRRAIFMKSARSDISEYLFFMDEFFS